MPETKPTTREQQTAAAHFLAAAQIGSRYKSRRDDCAAALQLARAIVVFAPGLHPDEVAGAAAFVALAHADPITARGLLT